MPIREDQFVTVVTLRPLGGGTQVVYVLDGTFDDDRAIDIVLEEESEVTLEPLTRESGWWDVVRTRVVRGYDR